MARYIFLVYSSLGISLDKSYREESRGVGCWKSSNPFVPSPLKSLPSPLNPNQSFSTSPFVFFRRGEKGSGGARPINIEGRAMEIQSTSWDSLRKQARKLEAQLDEQLNAYRRLVSAKPDGSEFDLESNIERLLKQLQQVNSQMQTWVSSGGSEILSHTLNRHREILQDLTQEFYRLCSSLKAMHEHASLLDFRDFDRARLDLEEGAGNEEHALLKEQTVVNRSTGQMDSVIFQAQATLGALVLQRSIFSGINTKLGNASSRLPTVNHILTTIRRRKSMDAIILSLVAAVCTFLILIYWLSK